MSVLQSNSSIKGYWDSPSATQTAGTIITVLVNPRRNCKTRAMSLRYRSGATVHAPAIMRSQGSTTLSAAAAAGQAVLNLTADPGTGTTPGAIAANDFVVYETAAGSWALAKVSSVSTLAITMTANVSAANAGAKVWFFGAPTDTCHLILAPTASAMTQFDGGGAPLFGSTGYYEPLVFHSNNATNAGFVDHFSGIYTSF